MDKNSLKELKALASLLIKRRKLVKLYNSDDETLDFSNLDSDTFFKRKYSEYEYLIVQGKRFNGVLSPFSREVNMEIKKTLTKKLCEHVEKLKQLFPFCDFSYLSKKIDNVVFNIRQVKGELISPVAAGCNTKYPIISLNLDSRYNNSSIGNAIIKHEFTHFCCKSKPKNPTFLNRIPTFLNEGITQIITIRLLEKENIDEEAMNNAYSTCYLNMKLANIFLKFIGDERIISSYFQQDFCLISQALKELNKKYSNNVIFNDSSADKIIIDDEFIKMFNHELWFLQLYLYGNIKTKQDNLMKIDDFPYLNKLMQYFDRITYNVTNNDNSSKMGYKDLIDDFRLSFNYILSELYYNKNQIQRD